MKIFNSLRKVKDAGRGSVVTIGVFDGVHIAHQKIIKRVVSRAAALGLKSAVITFDPHPAKVAASRLPAPSILSLEHRIRLIGEMGVDIVLVLPFTRSFADLKPENFVSCVLAETLHSREVYVGENFYFGRGGRAGVLALERFSGRYGFKLNVVPSVKIGKRIVSSSEIRRYILSGELRKASKFLGRSVSVLGTVVSGSKFARLLGYPTANINPHHEAIPPSGVYAVRVRCRGRLFKGLLNIAVEPTFFAPRDKEPKIEAHIFGFRGSIYGQDIEIYFVSKIRDERPFKTVSALIRQIRHDASIARKILM